MSEKPRKNRKPSSGMAGQAGQTAQALVPPVAPPLMDTIFLMLMGAAVAQIIAAVLGVLHASSDAYRQESITQLEATGVKDITPEMLEVMSVATVGTTILVAVAAVILYVVIGLFLKKGMGWARLAGTGLALISFSRYVGVSSPGDLATVLQIVLGVAAIALCFMGPAAEFFKEKKTYKLARRKLVRR
ncbi:hypothetical protein ACX80D_08440 [Arthrobacter sp. Sr24]